MGVGVGGTSRAAAVVKVLVQQTAIYTTEIRREIRLFGWSSSMKKFGED
jgi:hypothetical protein